MCDEESSLASLTLEIGLIGGVGALLLVGAIVGAVLGARCIRQRTSHKKYHKTHVVTDVHLVRALSFCMREF